MKGGSDMKRSTLYITIAVISLLVSVVLIQHIFAQPVIMKMKLQEVALPRVVPPAVVASLGPHDSITAFGHTIVINEFKSDGTISFTLDGGSKLAMGPDGIALPTLNFIIWRLHDYPSYDLVLVAIAPM
jgi:hypothetical protein